MPRRVPPIAIAAAIAALVLIGAIVVGLTTGSRPLPTCTPTPGITTGPLSCATASSSPIRSTSSPGATP